ncbi:MAG: tocopherol cyclase [Actinomycetota bacterium]|nr:tocopherol cyclase [Actinomycetota bacterium]
MSAVARRITGTMHPEGCHRQGPGSFEGWYVKVVTPDLGQRWAVIPGIFRGLDGTDEAFVQVLDGGTGRSWYHRYDAAEFRGAADRFDVSVGPNRFTDRGFDLHLPQLTGQLAVTSRLDPWPVRPWSPGVMGWYAWMPSMECYHGVVSFGHSLAGVLEVEGSPVDFAGSRGYIEKDWGQAFPAGYLWAHSNTFRHSDASLMASVALIPWRGREFRGFIVGLRTGGKLHRFATYTGARSADLRVDDDHVTWTLRTRGPGAHWQLDLRAARVTGGLLHAPIRTQMHKRVEETLDSTVEVRLSRGGRVVFEDIGDAAGLEVHGDTDRLLATSENT